MARQQMIGIEEAASLLETHYGLQAKMKQLPGEFDLNFRATTETAIYTFKISRLNEDPDILDLQAAALLHLEQQSIPFDLPLIHPNRTAAYKTAIDEAHGQRFLRLLQWVPGQLLVKTSWHSSALLESIGASCGHLVKGLADFDHPAAHRPFKWDLAQAGWIKEHRDDLTSEQQALFDHFIKMYEQDTTPHLSKLRQGVIYNDANDHNILVKDGLDEQKVSGVIDFGDIIHSHLINELAIACAYALMGKRDPLAAARSIVKGFHRIFPLTETEIRLLYSLISMRLLVSGTNAAINARLEPNNAYLQVSAQPAWTLLAQWKNIAPALALAHFRHACGWLPSPKAAAFTQWQAQQSFVPVVDTEDRSIRPLNLSVGSADLGHNRNFEGIDAFCSCIDQLLPHEAIGIGGYGEVRPFYTTDAYLVQSDNGPQWRTVHLGLDIWAAAGTPIKAPYPARVKSIQDNAGERNYGPTIILEHQTETGLFFYSLYGHLDQQALKQLQVGQEIAAGQQIAAIGDRPINGNWPPHLHFQLLLDLLDYEGDFPGVAFPETADIWLSLCPDPAKMALSNSALQLLQSHRQKIQLPPLSNLLGQRKTTLGPSLSVSYQQPLHIQRAYRQYLYDRTARRYLDTVNNVAHVGHQHPKVVDAAVRQIGLLNTNTRYIHDQILQYADQLLATFPAALNIVHFVNSGSEANELAIRMAQAFSGQKDMIAVEVGYHGNTSGCVNLSSYKFDGKGGHGAPPNTHIVPMPDVYRGAHRGPEAGPKYAASVQQTIDQLATQGRKPAGFICEGILSCGGQIVLPDGYLRTAFEAVRGAGGLCIVDEVQTGFGRVGQHFWAFELQGVVPDIVTLGKPIGNGHPLGAVICTRAVADAFANGMEYFNTFGGNPVSCAVGQAVLEVVQEEGLQQHALKMGQLLKAGLRELQQDFPIIGDVRGEGLFVGFELVRDPISKEPADLEASYLANRMRERGILMSTDGPLHNVIKTKPPMCFDQRNLDFLLTELRRVMNRWAN